MTSPILLILLFAFSLLFLVGAYQMVGTYNRLMRLRNNIKKSWSNIDVLLKQRCDEIPNLARVAKGYMKYEREVLSNISEARSAYLKARTVAGKVKSDDLTEKALNNFYAVAEKYPDLKADKYFIRLQERITELENEIADRREFYNDSVITYNTRIESLPDKFMADLLDLNRWSLFRFKKKRKK